MGFIKNRKELINRLDDSKCSDLMTVAEFNIGVFMFVFFITTERPCPKCYGQVENNAIITMQQISPIKSKENAATY